MMQTIKGFFKKEMLQTLRDPRMRVLLFLVPCLQMTIFGMALSTEARNIRLSLDSSSGDQVLDKIKERALASGWFIDAGYDGAGDPFALVRDGKADVVIVPPTGGLDQANTNEVSHLQILIDASNVTRAQAINRYLEAIVGKISLDQNVRSGLMSQALPINFDVRVLYNPTLRSAVFLVPGIMSVVMCLITILLTSMSITKEKELGTFETIISAPISSMEVILGKTIPYVLLGLANIPLILGVAVFLFDVPMRGSMLTLIASSFIFICATVATGIFISTITRTQQQAMMGGFIYLMPSLLISGLIVPVSSMPIPLQIISYANPLTYFMELLRSIMLKGGESGLVVRDLSIMTAMAIVIAFFSIRRFKTIL